MSLLGAIVPLAASAEDAIDFDPHSQAWNGLSGWVVGAEALGTNVVIPETLDMGALDPSVHALLFVHPERPLPVASVAAFLRDGGRVAIADDAGASGDLLRHFGVGRSRPDRDGALRVRGDADLLVARPRFYHPLTEGIDALVTNHPTALQHASLEPIFAFGRGRDALVLSGRVGEGRIVILGDASVLINNMLHYEGNARFGEHLARVLDPNGAGSIYVVTGRTPISGHFGDTATGGSLAELRLWLNRIAHADLPDPVLLVACLVVLGVFSTFAFGAMAFDSPYTARTLLPPPPRPGIYSGWVDFFENQPRNLRHPMTIYTSELEAELAERLGTPTPLSLGEAVQAMRVAGFSEAEIAGARDLLSKLEELAGEEERGAESRVGKKRFVALVREGERLLRRASARERDR